MYPKVLPGPLARNYWPKKKNENKSLRQKTGRRLARRGRENEAVKKKYSAG
jgi:hypothetical protein